jgi:tRNA-2-methylthio-N6-dimethylallyladenosine synthase
VRSYHVTTFGCQMNAHDSERIKGMLEELGLGEAREQGEADVLVFNTCTIREKPDQRFAAHLAQARALKERDPEKVIAVGGCYAEAQRERLFSLYPYVDVAFGPGSIPHLGEWLGAGGEGVARGLVRDRGRASLRGSAAAPPRAPLPGLGANLDGLQLGLLVLHRPLGARPRGLAPTGEILAEVEDLAYAGVKELTLLGQT